MCEFIYVLLFQTLAAYIEVMANNNKQQFSLRRRSKHLDLDLGVTTRVGLTIQVGLSKRETSHSAL